MSESNQITYRGTWTLQNKLGITDARQLERADRLLTRTRAREGIPNGRFDTAHLKAIHQHLFQDVYKWAGDLRNRDHWIQNTQFVKGASVEKSTDNLLSLLKESNHLKELNQYEFTGLVARYYARLNEIHPFREGNGRVQRAFFSQIAREAGFNIDWKQFSLEQWKEANHEATQGNDRLMHDMFNKATYSLEKTPEQKQRSLSGAFLKLPQEQAVRLYPELKKIYSVRDQAIMIADQKLGKSHSRRRELVSNVVRHSIHEMAAQSQIHKQKTPKKDMGIEI